MTELENLQQEAENLKLSIKVSSLNLRNPKL